MIDGSLDLLYQKNKFLRELEKAPPPDKTRIILPWSVEERGFSTSNFHPSKVHYRVGIEEIKKVTFS